MSTMKKSVRMRASSGAVFSAEVSRAQRGALLLLMSSCMGLAACSADVGEPGSEVGDEQIRQMKAAVSNGEAISGDDYSGVVRLWTNNTKFNEVRQFCGGVLLRNNVVLTARHCLVFPAEALAWGWPDISSNVSKVAVSTDRIGFVTLGVGAPAYAPDGRDLVAFKLRANLPVRVGGQVKTSDYFTKLSGTPANGWALAVIGYGPPSDPTSPICKYVSQQTGQRLKGCVADMFQPNWRLGTAFNNGAEILTIGVTATPGDSGGATKLFSFTGDSLADLPLAGINSIARRCVPATSSNCGAVSVRLDDLGTWLALLQ
jgi:hypothetical protein